METNSLNLQVAVRLRILIYMSGSVEIKVVETIALVRLVYYEYLIVLCSSCVFLKWVLHSMSSAPGSQGGTSAARHMTPG